ncbi:MAG: hypothetical protein Q9181_004377 [Wetmoreana brouardii]
MSHRSELQPILTKEACPPAGPYVQSPFSFTSEAPSIANFFPSQSQALLTPHALYISGQLPAASDGSLPSGTIAQKTKLCITNLKAILSAAGSDVSRVVKTTVFLTDMANFAEMNGEYEKHFGVNGAPKPARSCVAVKELPKGVEVEIECVALPGSGGAGEGKEEEEAARRVMEH